MTLATQDLVRIEQADAQLGQLVVADPVLNSALAAARAAINVLRVRGREPYVPS